MQVVAEGVPQRLMDMPTERIVDRRQKRERRNTSERRKPSVQLEAPVEAPVDPWPTPAPTPAWNRVVFVSLATFACGVLLTMTVDRFTRHARAKMVAPASNATSAPTPAAPTPATAPALVVQPLPQPAAEPAPAAAPAPQSPQPVQPVQPVIDLHPRKLRTAAKVPASRPRQPAPATSPPPVKAPRAKWVDPFAD